MQSNSPSVWHDDGEFDNFYSILILPKPLPKLATTFHRFLT